ncbi:hypothetical protein PV325_012778, partial [Microctonus aethiopoides]
MATMLGSGKWGARSSTHCNSTCNGSRFGAKKLSAQEKSWFSFPLQYVLKKPSMHPSSHGCLDNVGYGYSTPDTYEQSTSQ